MRKRLISLCLTGLLLLTAGCGQAEPVPPASEAPPEQAAELIDPHALEIEIPEEYRDLLIITTDFPTADEHWVSLLSVQEKASVEAMEKDYGIGAGGGFLFGISAMDQVGFERFLQYDYSGCDVFARGGDWYYARTYPTDVQFYRSGGVIDSETEDWKTWETLNTLGDQVCKDFVDRNGLTPYSQREVRNQPFTWEGEHAYAKYYPSYNSEGSKSEFYTLVLSQPAKQGENGLWCVDRFYDEYGSLCLYFPESDMAAAEYYANLQAECDAGQHPELLTPLGAAKDFVANSVWFSDETTGENVELTEGVDSDYMETNLRASRVIASLLVQPEAVTDQELLDCIGAFRNDTRGFIEGNFNDSDWWTPLQAALENAAVGDGQADRNRSMMQFYLTSFGQYADLIAGLLQNQYVAEPETFQDVLEEFYPEQQLVLLAAIE